LSVCSVGSDVVTTACWWVDDTGHAGLAMRGGAAVEPHRVGVFDSDLEDVGLEGLALLVKLL
jgi:hypothetical protein